MIDARILCIALWSLLCLSVLSWISLGYSTALCVAAALVMAAPLPGLVRNQRRTFVWASLFVVPYFAFAAGELLVSPAARVIALVAFLLMMAWLFASTAYLRRTRAARRNSTPRH